MNGRLLANDNKGNMPVPTAPENVPEPDPNEGVEKSQNDHLNKKLLCSFMQRLNQTQAEPCENSVSNVENEDDEFDT